MSDPQNDVTTPALIEQVIDSGLFCFDDEPHFSWQGCEHCADGLGAEVYDLRGLSRSGQWRTVRVSCVRRLHSHQYYGGN